MLIGISVQYNRSKGIQISIPESLLTWWNIYLEKGLWANKTKPNQVKSWLCYLVDQALTLAGSEVGLYLPYKLF